MRIEKPPFGIPVRGIGAAVDLTAEVYYSTHSLVVLTQKRYPEEQMRIEKTDRLMVRLNFSMHPPVGLRQ